MTELSAPAARAGLVCIEPGDRLVVLARILDVAEAAAAHLEAEVRGGDFGPACLGQALYRHGTVFRSTSDAPVWSHVELSYFRDFVPGNVIRERVAQSQPPGVRLLRAELLLTTPASFVLPRTWAGLRSRAGYRASLEFIDVQPGFLGAYRETMQFKIGPSAAWLVAEGCIGTFRAMETAAVLHHDPAFAIAWNQIHLAEMPAENFSGFGPAFAKVPQEVAPAGGLAAVFAGLDGIRTLPRWTLNEAVVEADGALADFVPA